MKAHKVQVTMQQPYRLSDSTFSVDSMSRGSVSSELTDPVKRHR